MVHLESENGEEILTFVPTKEYQSVVFSSAALRQASGYTLYSGGDSTGQQKDGLFGTLPESVKGVC